jgi:hypothetical protein
MKLVHYDIIISNTLMWHMSFAKCKHDLDNRTQLWKDYFKFKLISNDKKIFKFQYLPHFMSKNFQTTFVKSYTWKVFQEYQECAQIPFSFDANKTSMKNLFNIQ